MTPLWRDLLQWGLGSLVLTWGCAVGVVAVAVVAILFIATLAQKVAS